jgi:hypothetical protein
MRRIDIQKRTPWYAHLFACTFALGAAVVGWYVPSELLRLTGDDPWEGFAAIMTAFLCLLGVCAGFCVGLQFGYGIAVRLFVGPAKVEEGEEPQASPREW